MLIKIKKYPSPFYPVALEAWENGKMIYQDVFQACMSDAEIRFQINSIWSGYNYRVKDCRV
jgi:hypothetical protein